MDEVVNLGDPLDVLADGGGVGRELLAEGHGNGILELGAPHFQHIGELAALGGKGFLQQRHLVHQLAQFGMQGQPESRGVGVVSRLAAVDVVVGVAVLVGAFFLAQKLERPVGDDLVGVHVGRGTGPALKDVDHKLVVQLAIDNFVTGRGDGLGDLGRQNPQFQVGQGRRFFHVGQGPNQFRAMGDGDAGNVEILQRPQGLHPEITMVEDLPVAEQIVFYPGFHSHCRHLLWV